MAYSEPVKTRKLTFGVFAMCLVLGTLVLLMWPLPVGPYPVTHGPTTALRATRAAVLIVWSLTIAILLVSSPQTSLAVTSRQSAVSENRTRSDSAFAALFILRC
jgi:hypothetical protein